MKTKILIILISILMIFNITMYVFPETKEIEPSSQIQQTQQEESEKWGALDEVVIEKFAKEKGKEPGPLIELEGDLLLFVFSLFSGIAGFFIGYYSRVIFVENQKK